MSAILDPSTEAHRERKHKKKHSQRKSSEDQQVAKMPENGSQLARNFAPEFKQASQPETSKPRYKGGNYGPGSISSRIEKAMVELEHQCWRCRLDKPSGLLDYIDPKAVFASPEYGILTDDSDPTLKETLEDDDMRTWNSFQITDMKIAELSMMSAAVTYTVECSITNEHGEEKGKYKAYCTSSWKQLASSKWKLCTYTEAPLPTKGH
jgi:hypothetical protein